MVRFKKTVDWSLYVITDAQVIGGRSLTAVVESALRGGATVLQYREKKKSTRAMVDEAMALAALCRTYHVPLLINDRIDVALAVDADGVHLGQDDMPLRLARRLLGPHRLIGLTVHHREEIEKAQQDGADYISLAPVFATPTKPDHQTPMGVDGLRRLMTWVRCPAVAIGGINAHNIRDVLQTGVNGVCVVSAILGQDDPERAARTLRALIASTPAS
ncbi:thiamine phosphate synthase [Desulfosoma caldarium]|uniref:Thiamine-phosphate synthase n=1 Tax=Desulfosoma caldarium TaxID=610254 RepID=A0A3N1UY06_9BACT|nr:thiamine phosphate synthase [Desulfosoma caldarium]ROQ93570.1 thiamine-phosphate diphosphorylase [Desulfosoma caldarium]